MIPKFRAWDKEEKEWLSIRTIGFDDDGSLWYLQAWDDNENDIDPPYFEDDLGVKWELLQSTGLKDKNGVEIYEGDILEGLDGVEYFFDNVEWNDKEAKYMRSDDIELWENVEELAVIGNKFSNPELFSKYRKGNEETTNQMRERLVLEPVFSDNVNHPNHYTQGDIETVDYIKDKLTDEEFRGFVKGNVLKYVSREGLKNGDEDLKKSDWYLNKLIEVLE